MNTEARNFKRTKMVCTIGPGSMDYEVLKKLAIEGLNIARVNGSHGDHAQHDQIIKTVRQVSMDINKPIGILYDLQGPKIRLGNLGEKGVMLYKGQRIILTTKNEFGPKLLPIQFDFTPYLKKGDPIFINDGFVELKTLKVTPGQVEAKVLDGGLLTSHKGINLPETKLPDIAITEKDKEDLAFAIKQNVDFVAISFVQSVKDVQTVRKILQEEKKDIWIISKIERRAALTNLEAIVDASDGVMVARGDLAIEAGMEEVPIIQRRIITLARKKSKPVIVATQMLESMISSRQPTRAEVNDVASAVYLKVSAVMLSAETATGHYPVETVTMMKKIIRRIEKQLTYAHPEIPETNATSNSNLAIASAAVDLAYRIKAELILVGTTSGATAQAVSGCRPNVPIVAVTHDDRVIRRLTLLWGVKAILVDKKMTTDEFITQAIEKILSRGFVKKGETIVVASGQQSGIVGGTNMIKVHTL